MIKGSGLRRELKFHRELGLFFGEFIVPMGDQK